MFSMKRCPPGISASHKRYECVRREPSGVHLNVTFLEHELTVGGAGCCFGCRYIEYMCDMMAEEPIIPHCKPIIIRSIVMTPVPLFNKQRNGCRPFCEVYVGDERVLTTSQEYDRMKSVSF